MRIERITLHHVRIPLIEPFRISSGAVAEKDAIVVAVSSDVLTGYGESSPMAGAFYGPETPESCWQELVERLAPSLVGRTFSSIEEASRFVDSLPASNFSKAGVETALWDLEAQRRAMPLHRLLGAKADEAVSGLAVGLYDDTRQLLATIERHLPDGYRRIKIKIEPGCDVEPVCAVLQTFPGVPLMVDANAAYRRAHFAVFEHMDAYGLAMFEQPLAAAALMDSAALQARLKTPVCLDESLDTPQALEEAISLGALRIANIKIQRLGGFSNALRFLEICRRSGIAVWVGTMPELGIGQAQGAALATLAGDYPTDVESSARWFKDDIIEPWIDVRGGVLRCPNTPGLGYTVVNEKLRRYCVARHSAAC